MTTDKYELVCAYWATDEAWQAVLRNQTPGQPPALKLIKLDDKQQSR